MNRILLLILLVALGATPVLADPPSKPKVIRDPVGGKPVKPSVSPSLRDVLRQREQKKVEEGKVSPHRQVLNDYLAKFPAARSATLLPIESSELKTLFANTSFFALRFRQFPVAIAPPKPLASNNVFAVSAKKVTHLVDVTALGRHFQNNLKPIDNQKAARSAAVAFLQLSEELHQDGFFQFQKPQVKVTSAKGGFIARGEGKVVPQRGDRGSLTVSLSFLQGKLENVRPGGKVSAGIRPRCQASRLLDPDPAIREIMRRDLIVMGRAAQFYLAEQWQQAGPKLRKEIEGVWQQILAEGR
jgi:hypothetical protein